MSRRVVLALQGDKHAGHTVGLCNPATILPPPDDGTGEGKPTKVKTNAFQRAIWRLYTADIRAVLEFADGDPVVVIDIGDQTQGKGHTDNQMSSRMADQFYIALANWDPWMNKPNVKTLRFAKGTGSHVYGEGSAELLIAKHLQGQYRALDIKTIYHGVIDIMNIKLDYAHHGPGPGIRDWTNGNQVRYYLKSLIMEQRRLGKKPCELYVRGHRHSFVHEAILSDTWAGRLYDYHIVTLPSYCGLGAYGVRATFSAPYQWFGTVAIEIIDGEVGRIKPFVHCRDIRTWEALYDGD